MKSRRSVKVEKSEPTIRDNDVMLARASDEVRHFFRFARPGALVERRVVYHVPAAVPVPASNNSAGTGPASASGSPSIVSTQQPSGAAKRASGKKSSSNNHQNQLLQQQPSYQMCPVDVLSPPAPSVISQALSFIDEVKHSVDSQYREMARQRRHENDDDDDDDDDDDSNTLDFASSFLERHNVGSNSSSSSRRNAGATIGAPSLSSSAFPSSMPQPTSSGSNSLLAASMRSPEGVAAAQSQGCFAFSRRNTARNFDIVGNVRHSAVGAAASGQQRRSGGGGAGAQQQQQQQSAGSGGAAASGAPSAGAQSKASKVIPVCLTLPLRTFTARTARAVHDISLLLAILGDVEG